MSTQIFGIDVSKFQGIIDWNMVKKAGKEFVFIRLGWCGYDGTIADNGLDNMFHKNIKGALAAGLHVGVYVYSYARTPAAAKKAANETLSLVKNYELRYPIAFDIEDTLYTKMSKAENSAIAEAFMSTTEKAGYYSMLYTYKSFAQSYLDMQSLRAYDVWIAQYAKKNTYNGSYGIWQYAGNDGRCAGISTPCDLNVANKDYATIIRRAGLNHLAIAQ